VSSSLYYRSSWSFAPMRLVLAAVMAALAVAALAAGEGYATLYVPYVGKVSLLLAFGFGMAAGFTLNAALRIGKVRSRTLSVAFALAGTVLAFYLSWAVWTYLFLRRGSAHDASLVALVLDPAQLWHAIVRINAHGAWSVRQVTPTGRLLWALWLAEAVVFCGTTFFAALGDGWSEAFCDRCRVWCKTQIDVARLAVHPHDQVRRELEAKDLAAIEQRGASAAGAQKYLRVDLESCPRCGESHFLTVAEMDDASEAEQGKAVVAQLVVSAATVERLRAIGQRAATP
jgi:hypothetical protein